MRVYDIITKKKEGGELTGEEIRFFIEGYCSGEIPDYQAAALLMAIYFRGMTAEETTALTLAVRDSGETLSLPEVDGLRVDKHSTGGVGDKTSLIVAPIVSACGVTVAKMSGRGLGHTGGTVDKLESIPGFKVDMTDGEFKAAVKRSGIAIVGQSATLAPADKKLYALRDVTATVDSIPLIASSIMGKKLAANDDCIVLDVKTGSGSFMKSVEDSERLARAMVDIGTLAGKKTVALITDMDAPLGRAIGNSLEVIEAIAVLSGKVKGALFDICIALSANMLVLSGKGSYPECEKMAIAAIESGRAKQKFKDMIDAQDGNSNIVDDISLLPSAKHSRELIASESGYISWVNAEEWGAAAQLLGAGRAKKEDKIDYAAGIYINKVRGEWVNAGESVATLYASDTSLFSAALNRLGKAYGISRDMPVLSPVVIKTVQ